MIFASRSARDGPDPHLQTKVRIFLVGAILALVGIGLESSLLVGLAIVVLLGGMLLRFLQGKRSFGGKTTSEEDNLHREDEDPD